MTIYNPEGTHERYTMTDRHYCPYSESYTGADSLLTAQRNGWRLVGLAYREDILLRGSRHTAVYYFKLQRGSEQMVMPILSNPFVMRMVRQYNIHVLPYSRTHKDAAEETVEAPQVLYAHA
jgi:hypothetical protein